MLTTAAVLALLGCAQSRRDDYPAEILKDEITSLPGLDSDTLAKFTMFSGYITVDATNNRSLFYWFIESLDSPATDPVALWSNGGPGCSGLSGLLTEQGPFRVNENLTLSVNEYSWVNAANMLFIEAPAGVGFSFSDDTSDYTTGDNQTAIDNYNFIRNWLTAFPNFASQEFYITSESYGGHYMPTLAQQIVLGNNAGNTPTINFQGFFVGNPYTDPVENAKGMYDTWFGHQLISQPAYDDWFLKCLDGNAGTIINIPCDIAGAKLTAQVGTKIDPYALDFPVCNSPFNERTWFMKHVIQDALHRPVPGVYKDLVKSLEKHLAGEDIGDDYEPCAEDYMGEWLNQAKVQTALHAKSTKWSMCSSKISYSRESMQNPMESTYRWLIANAPDIRMTIVSGDDDSVCGTLGTQSWLWNMNFTVSEGFDWELWLDDNKQTGGWLTKFENALNLVTVHTAGHMIPQTQPMRSLQTFRMYLDSDI